MDGTAAGLIAVVENRHGMCGSIRVWPPSHRLALDIRPQILALEIAQFVMWLEVRRFQSRAALETDDLHARLGEFGGKNATGSSDTYDHQICFFGCHSSALLTLWPVPEGRRSARAWTASCC